MKKKKLLANIIVYVLTTIFMFLGLLTFIGKINLLVFVLITLLYINEISSLIEFLND